MKNKCGIIVGMSCERIKKLIIGAVSLTAFADEVPTGDVGDTGDTNNPSPKSPIINYEDLIAKARKEEKEKQYKTIEKLKTQIATLTEQHNADLLRVAEFEKRVKDAEAKLTTANKGDSEEVTTLKNEIEALKKDKATLESKVTAFESQPPVSREDIEAQVRAEFEAEYEVKTYKATKLAELKDDILVPELVMGDTKEAIDESIKSALDRSAEIRKNLGISDKAKTKRTPKTPANPSVSGIQDTEVSLERLATMDVRSEEYATLRRQLGLR